MDTSAYAALLGGNRGIKEAVQQADEIVLNPVVLGELIAGFLIGRNEKRNRAILKEFLSSPRVIIAEKEESGYCISRKFSTKGVLPIHSAPSV